MDDESVINFVKPTAVFNSSINTTEFNAHGNHYEPFALKYGLVATIALR